ncbi:MAG: hypothetical protein JWN07_1630 [Hyphomicrobiales bacterium]|nr:hypothetical protein [Hyphomicrobiales bacterium]
MTHRAKLSRIHLEVAPGPHEAATGPAYDFVAPLDEAGKIDADAWKSDRALCFVHRTEDGDVRHGLLVHRSGGATGATWTFDYEPGNGDEETGFRFEAHVFTPGAYASVLDADGSARTYRVASVKPA